VPEYLHNEIASTGFTIVRPTDKINPFYLHFALRMPSTLEQFRKWSTGSSYPAILDEDVAKTLIPVPTIQVQDEIAIKLLNLYSARMTLLEKVNSDSDAAINEITQQLSKSDYEPLSKSELNQVAAPRREPSWDGNPTVESIFKCISELPPVSIDQKKKRSKQPVSNDRL
jgi:type I restriction enzyme S subunit